VHLLEECVVTRHRRALSSDLAVLQERSSACAVVRHHPKGSWGAGWYLISIYRSGGYFLSTYWPVAFARMYPGRWACRLSSPRLAGGPYSWHTVTGSRRRVSAGVTSTNGSGGMALVSQASGSGIEPLRPPRVFISYAHEPGAAHHGLVRQLWLFLREHWIDARVDLVAAEQRQDWSLWMADEIRRADYIVVVASPAYRALAQGHSGPAIGRGVQWEARLIRDAFYREPKPLNRFVPVILPGQSIDGVPDFLAPATTTTYHIHDFTVSGAEPLLRLLHAQPFEVEPPLGERPELLPNSPQPSGMHATITIGSDQAAERLHHPSVEGTADGLPAEPGRAAHTGSIDSTAFGSDEGGQTRTGQHPSRTGNGNEARSGRASAVPGLSISVPIESGPAVVCGRDDIVDTLVETLTQQTHTRPHLLVGAGGMGKSTVARSVADKARQRDPSRRAWWLSAANEQALAGGLVSLADRLGASTADQETIRSHTVGDLGDVADRIWALLEKRPPGWLLVLDNADDPTILGPADGTGWIRRTDRGLVLVTTRNGNETAWPGDTDVTRLGPLSVEAATDVLRRLAPDAGDRATASSLAVRLGCLPLALRLAGIYLRQPFVAWPTFTQYQQALDNEGIAHVLLAPDRADPRAMITQTWELSLDALERAGTPQARPLLWLLSCYAPGSPIPADIVTALCPDGQTSQRARQTHPLHDLLDPEGQQTPAELVSTCLAGLTALASFGLIQRRDSETGTPHIDLHPVIAEATRAVLADSASRGRTAASQVRDSAVAAVGAAISHLDVGRSDHWPRFHLLTSHVQELLATTARDLGRRQRCQLLDYMVSCITSYLWSRAESRAEQLAADALTRARELGCATLPASLRLRHVLGWALREQGRFGEAAAYLSQVLDEQQCLRGGVTRPDALRTRHDLAWTKGRLGHWDDAAAELRAVLEEYRVQRRRRGQGADDAFALHTRCKLYWCIGKQGCWDLAERNYRQLLTDRSSVLGAEHPDTLDTRESLGKALAWQARWDDAQAEFATLAAARERTLGEQHPDTLLAHQLHAYVIGYQARQHHDDSALLATISRLEWVVREQEFVRGAEHPNTQDSHAFLAALRGVYRAEAGMRWTDDLPSLDV
jgi:hypothetical protein